MKNKNIFYKTKNNIYIQNVSKNEHNIAKNLE